MGRRCGVLCCQTRAVDLSKDASRLATTKSPEHAYEQHSLQCPHRTGLQAAASGCTVGRSAATTPKGRTRGSLFSEDRRKLDVCCHCQLSAWRYKSWLQHPVAPGRPRAEAHSCGSVTASLPCQDGRSYL